MLCCFFQAEGGIRDYKVTGVQTCALPIFPRPPSRLHKACTRLVSSISSSLTEAASMFRRLCPDLQKFSRGLRNGMLRRSEEHTSELQSPCNLVCRLLLEKKKKYNKRTPCL